MNPVTHAAGRAAFSAVLDVAIRSVRSGGPEKMSENAVKLVELARPFLNKGRYTDAQIDQAVAFVKNVDGKWMDFAYRAITELDPHILKMNALNLVYEGMF